MIYGTAPSNKGGFRFLFFSWSNFFLLEKLRIIGGNRLSGSVRISGAKNAVLPILAASLLTADELVLHNVPHLADVKTMLSLLEGMGVTCHQTGKPSGCALRM